MGNQQVKFRVVLLASMFILYATPETSVAINTGKSDVNRAATGKHTLDSSSTGEGSGPPRPGSSNQRKTLKSDYRPDGKLNAGGRIKEALKMLVGAPIVGAYIGTAGGYIPTVYGAVGGAAVGGVYGVIGGVTVLVTGEPMGSDSGPSKSDPVPRYKGVREGGQHEYREKHYRHGWIASYRGPFKDGKENGDGKCRFRNGNWGVCTFSGGKLITSYY